MEKNYHLNAGIPLPELSEPAMQSWNNNNNSFSLYQDVNCTSRLTSSACALNPYFHKQNNDNFTQFHSPALSSVVSSSPPTSSVAVVNKVIGIRELIQKLGPICNPAGNPAPFSSGAGLVPAPSIGVGNVGVVVDPVFTAKPQEILPNLANSLILNPPPPSLPAISTDPDFAERAAKFYNFGNRSFTAQNDTELTRVWCNPISSSIGNQKSCQNQMEINNLNELQQPVAPNSNESSSISEQVPSGETVSEVSNEMNSRKRKAVSKSKAKKNVSPEAAIISQKAAEGDGAKNGKRAKMEKASLNGKDGINREGEGVEDVDGDSVALDEEHKQDKVTRKLPEPPKDYIHVRARRGQATDSHSLAERVRREKIGERMKLLQDLVPGCNKVTGKALMLDEIINYVQSLQRQVEFLSMKLASVDPRQEVDTSKAMMQTNGSLSHSLYPVDFSMPSFYGHQPKQLTSVDTNVSMSQCSVDPVHKPSYHHELQLPSLHGFADGLPQFPEFCEDDLQSVVRMGFSQDANSETAFQSMSFPANQLQP